MLLLEKIFSDHMMLQRNRENRLFGWDNPGERIHIYIKNLSYETLADETGYWEIMLSPMQEGGPYSMLLIGSSQVEVKDILIGDVYFLSGQSNMEMKITETLDVTKLETLEEINEIRFLSVVPNFVYDDKQVTLPSLSWKRAEKNNFSDMSAIGYFFALEIMKHQNIPIGLIQTAVGGSSIEAWMCKETLEALENPCSEIIPFQEPGALEKTIMEQVKIREAWSKPLLEEQESSLDHWEDWYLPQIIQADQKEAYYGSIWLEKEFILEELPTKDAVLRMGLMIDEGSIWINGYYIGRGLHRYEMLRFPVSKEILKKGSNIIRVRLIVAGGLGGFVPQKPYQLLLGESTVDLCGLWKLKMGLRVETKAPDVLFPPLLPLGLFYGVLRPLKSLEFQSVLWYQGESNVGHLEDYKELFYEMKKDWEREFERPLNFCCVELANYQDPLNQVTDTGWAKIRDDQRRCRMEDNKTEGLIGVVSAMDLGEKTDLHPHNKKEVAYRISLWVRKHIYQEEVCCQGPVLDSFEKNGNQIILHFLYDDAKDQPIANFEILTKEGFWVKKEAIHKDSCVKIMIQDEDANKLRYAWYDNPGPLNFYNQQGLPAECFLIEFE